MIQVASFSGGRTSAYLCAVLLERFDRGDLRFVFMDTGAEHPATYDFIRKVDAHFGLDLVCLRCDASAPLGKGVEPYQVGLDEIGQDLVPFRSICDKYGTPTVASAWCTSRMKEDIHDKWCDDVYGRSEYVTWIGVRADEPRRLGGMGRDPLKRYLAEIDDADKMDVLDYWRAMPFDLEIPEHLGNCVFCVKKSSMKLALAARDEPEMAERWVQMLRSAPDRLKRGDDRSENVYRSHRTLAEVLGLYEGVCTDELRSRVRSARNDSNTCSESCEVFVSERQLDLFSA